MRKQTVMWTALPNGIVPGSGGARLRLSAFLSPRLWTDEGLPKPTLALFPDFLDWPATEIQFQVQFGNSAPVAATRVGDPPRSDLWQSLFTSTTYVKPHAFDKLDHLPIRSYPIRNVQGFLKQQYVDLALTAGEEYPHLQTLLGPESFGAILFDQRTGNNEEQLTRALEAVLARRGFIPPGPPAPASDFLQLKLFHRPRSKNRLPSIPLPEIDFHRMVSLLGDYPVLLRLLGLVHDLEVPYPTGSPASTTVQVLASWTPQEPNTTKIPAGTGSRRQLTRCLVSTNDFRAAPRATNPEQAAGLLKLDDATAYELVQIDVDGAALKALDFSKNLNRAVSLYRTDDTPDSYAVPSLRSAGLAVARVGQAAQTKGRFLLASLQNQNLETSADNGLDAEDLTRGYCFDVWDSASKQWHSLGQRVGTYQFLTSSQTLTGVEDEGWVSFGVTSAADESSPDLYQQESLARWWGWSLAAPRPGKTIDAEGQPTTPPNQAPTEFKLIAHFQAKPGSLPRLRYGTSYRLRARAVDLAGNRRDLNDPGLAALPHLTPEIRYGRFEPVAAPEVVLRKPRTEGESLERIVIRSNYNAPAGGPSERHVAPPKIAQPMAEDHGLFDTAAGAVDAGAYGLIAAKEGGTFHDVGTPDPANYDQPYVDANSLTLPYLPDLFSRGAMLRGLPGAPPAYPVSFGYDAGVAWPAAAPFRIVVQEGSGAPSFDATNRVLTVLLPKAEMAEVRLSSFVTDADLDKLGLLVWLEEGGHPTATVRAQATAGAHWMLTPYRTLTLVHAVRQPLLPPTFRELNAGKVIGNTFATISDRLKLSRKSTIKVDILATWSEPIDPLDEPTWKIIQGNARPFEIPVPLASSAVEEEALSFQNRHEFGDTKHRAVTYAAVATSRFGEYFQERTQVSLTGTAPTVLNPAGIVDGTDRVRALDGSVAYVRGIDWQPNYVAGTIRRTPGSQIPDGAAVDVSYIAPPITRDTEVSVTLDVLNSARPATPQVLYIVPTFGWESTGTPDGSSFESHRRGGGLRVYLDRPWWSSGEGELLGVVLWPPSGRGFTTIPDPVKPYVTQWGLDPVFLSGATSALPTLAAFKRSLPTQHGTGLTLDEIAGYTVSVAGHTVGFDADRRLWYCDIEIDAGSSYFPFVRLALARYQPKSVANAHLSRVVPADFIQLAPDRFASITRDSGNPNAFTISVTGRSYQALRSQPGPSTVEVSLERRRPDLNLSLAGEVAWEPVPNSQPVILTPASGQSGETTWSGKFTIPAGTECRAVVKEFEIYPVASSVALPPQRRLVYVDTIELNPQRLFLPVLGRNGS